MLSQGVEVFQSLTWNMGPSRVLHRAMLLPGFLPQCFSLPALPSSVLPSSGGAPPSGGHFLMPFLNLAPIPPKSNQIHNLIRQKNEENVRLPASPLTGRRPAANLEIGKCYNGGTTDDWGSSGGAGRPCWRATRFALSKSGPHIPLAQRSVWKGTA